MFTTRAASVIAGVVYALGCAPALAAGSLSDRLAALTQAVESEAGAFTPKPAANARIAWSFIDADRRPDAIVVVKKDASDCAVHYNAKSAPCMGYLFRAADGDRFAALTAFPYFGQPVCFGPPGATGRSLYFADRNAKDALHDKYVMREGAYQLAGQGLKKEQVYEECMLVLTDRTMDRLADQFYTARNFPKAGEALLAPVRVHVDEINSLYRAYAPIAFMTEGGLARKRDAVMRAGKALFDPAMNDAATVVARTGWAGQLNVRLWACGDWVVVRRFWEVEQDGLADVGVCLEPLAFWDKGVWQNDLKVKPERALVLMRARLYEELGIAMLLRGEFLPVARVEALKAQSNHSDATTQAIVTVGTAVGAMLAAMTGGPDAEVFASSHDDWKNLVGNWFVEVEYALAGYPTPTPELRAFAQDLEFRRLGVACALAAGMTGKSGGSANGQKSAQDASQCPAGLKEEVETIAKIMRSRWQQ